MASPNQKQHDGHYVLHTGERIGVEVEAADFKTGDKLARFAAQCFNSITNDRVQQIQILVQTESARHHYAKPFIAGQTYCPVWIKENGRWYPRQSSKTIISPDLEAKVKVDLVLSEKDVADKLLPEPTIWLPHSDA